MSTTENTKKKLPKLFVSFDVESDGPTPTLNSMLALGVCFMTVDGVVVDEVEYHFPPLANRKSDPSTMEFWTKPENDKAWKYLEENQVDPRWAMFELSQRIENLMTMYDLEFISWPSCYDWMFLKCYYEEFGPPQKANIGYRCTDIGSEMNSFAIALGKKMGEFKNYFQQVNKTPHVSLADARIQGRAYVSFNKWRQTLKPLLSGVELKAFY